MTEQPSSTSELNSTPVNALPAVEPVGAEPQPTVVESADESDDALDEDVEGFIGASGSIELPDPDAVVTIRTSGGGDKYVPVSQPTPVRDVIALSGLYFGGAVQYWLNGAQVTSETLVPGGSTLSVIGSVKGG